MFIEIERDIIEDAVKNSTKSQLNHSAEILLQFALAIQRGTHVVLIHSIIDPNYKKLFEGLNEIIGERYVNLFRSVIAQRTMWSAISTNIDKKVVITLNTKRTTSSTEIIINPSILSDFHFEQETHLLTENLLDAKFYEYLILYYKKQNGLKGSLTKFYALNGGGVTLYKVLEYELNNNNHFCVSITDSDKIGPKAKLGDTYNNAQKIWNEFENSTCLLYHMNEVAEIENLIPIALLKKHAPKNPQHINWNGKDLSYYDIKEGLKAHTLYGNIGIIDDWANEFPEVDFSAVMQIRKNSKSRNAYYGKLRDNHINDNLVNIHWGPDILARVSEAENSFLYNVGKTDLTDSQHVEWERIGKNIFTWTCALKSRK